MISKEEQYKLCEVIETEFKCRTIKNEIEPYILYSASDIGKIIGLSNISANLSCYSSKYKVFKNVKTSGGMQNMTYLTHSGVLKVLSKCRKPECLNVINRLNVNVCLNLFPSVEVETIANIKNCFDMHEMITQYKIGKYRVDLYFPMFKLIVECDEKYHHSVVNITKDIEREDVIKEIIIDAVFIRYKPQEDGFNILEIIKKIHKHIVNY